MKFKKIIAGFLWLLLLAGVITVVVYAGKVHDDTLCRKYAIHITVPEGSDTLLYETDIRNIVWEHGDSLTGKRINEIDINALERRLEANIYIASAEISGNLDGRLLFNINQRKPVIRVMNKHNEQFYLDETGAVIPVRSKIPIHVLAANGNIAARYDDIIASDTIIPEISRLIQCVQVINSDDFLKAQIGQIYVEKNGDYLLIPLVGEHIILLGDGYHCADKLQKLKIFYERGINARQWCKSKDIDLRYDNQIVVHNK